jgi:hypothetical protein
VESQHGIHTKTKSSASNASLRTKQKHDEFESSKQTDSGAASENSIDQEASGQHFAENASGKQFLSTTPASSSLNSNCSSPSKLSPLKRKLSAGYEDDDEEDEERQFGLDEDEEYFIEEEDVSKSKRAEHCNLNSSEVDDAEEVDGDDELSPELSFSSSVSNGSMPRKKMRSSSSLSSINKSSLNNNNNNKCKDPIGDEIRKLEEKQKREANF